MRRQLVHNAHRNTRQLGYRYTSMRFEIRSSLLAGLAVLALACSSADTATTRSIEHGRRRWCMRWMHDQWTLGCGGCRRRRRRRLECPRREHGRHRPQEEAAVAPDRPAKTASIAARASAIWRLSSANEKRAFDRTVALDSRFSVTENTPGKQASGETCRKLRPPGRGGLAWQDEAGAPRLLRRSLRRRPRRRATLRDRVHRGGVPTISPTR